MSGLRAGDSVFFRCYPADMTSNIVVIDSAFHPNGRAAPFYAAIVDDASSDDTKLVIMFGEEDYIAVLSLDSLIDEDVSVERNGWRGDKYEAALRAALWTGDEDE